MKLVRVVVFFIGLIAFVTLSAYLLAVVSSAQTITQSLRPDVSRALNATPHRGSKARANAYQPARPVMQRGLRPKRIADKRVAQVNRNDIHPLAGPISPGTALSKVLHTSMLSMTSTAGTDEEYLDRTNDLVADDRTTFDSAGGSFDIAVGKSGTRYEVFSATLNNELEKTS